MTPEQAATTPKTNRNVISEEAYKIGESHGLTRKLVYQRWSRGMDIERAITTPKITRN